MRHAFAATLVLLAGCASVPPQASQRPPVDHGERAILDAHRHNFPAASGGEPVGAMLAAMDAAGIDRSVMHFVDRADYDGWDAGHENRFLRGVAFPCWKDTDGRFYHCDWGESGFPDIDWLRAEARSGRLTHLGELLFVYAGIAPADPRMEPYWSLAEEFDLPVLVHLNRGPNPGTPSRPDGCCPSFDADLGNPELYRPVLEKHPRLKLVLQHFGFPAAPMFGNVGYVEESFRLLHDFPQVMVDTTALQSVPAIPPPVLPALVRRMKAEGLLDRLMFGTDGWPAQPIVDRFEAMDFLTPEERKAILHDNAARLFAVD